MYRGNHRLGIARLFYVLRFTSPVGSLWKDRQKNFHRPVTWALHGGGGSIGSSPWWKAEIWICSSHFCTRPVTAEPFSAAWICLSWWKTPLWTWASLCFRKKSDTFLKKSQLCLKFLTNLSRNPDLQVLFFKRNTPIGVQIQGGTQTSGWISHSYVGRSELKSAGGKAGNTAWVQGIRPPQWKGHRQGPFQQNFRN